MAEARGTCALEKDASPNHSTTRPFLRPWFLSVYRTFCPTSTTCFCVERSCHFLQRLDTWQYSVLG